MLRTLFLAVGSLLILCAPAAADWREVAGKTIESTVEYTYDRKRCSATNRYYFSEQGKLFEYHGATRCGSEIGTPEKDMGNIYDLTRSSGEIVSPGVAAGFRNSYSYEDNGSSLTLKTDVGHGTDHNRKHLTITYGEPCSVRWKFLDLEVFKFKRSVSCKIIDGRP